MADHIVLSRPTNLRPGILFSRGIIALLFSALCFSAPDATIFVFTVFVGAFLFFDGVLTLFTQVTSRRKDNPTFWPVLTGILGITAGVLTFVNPAATAWALSLLVGTWAVILGMLEIMAAVEMRSDVTVSRGMRVFFGLCGVATIFLGVVIFTEPAVGGLTLVTLLAANALIVGVVSIALAWNVRKRSREIVPSDYYEEEKKRAA